MKSLSLPRQLGLMGAVAALLVFGSAGAATMSASAHDQVVSTSPEDGSEVSAAPTQVEITFSDSILDIGSTIQVVDAAGVNWADGDVVSAGAIATQPVKAGLPAGSYEVRWRVVSADGHPISGAFHFTTASPAPPAVGTPPATTTAAATTSSSPAAAAAAPAQASSQPAATSDPDTAPLIVVGAIGAVVGVGVFVLVMLVRGRRNRHRDQQ
ncbi:hypothetical protein BH09ACT6_BH09ACT6_13620 [soil metagenome]